MRNILIALSVSMFFNTIIMASNIDMPDEYVDVECRGISEDNFHIIGRIDPVKKKGGLYRKSSSGLRTIAAQAEVHTAHGAYGIINQINIDYVDNKKINWYSKQYKKSCFAILNPSHHLRVSKRHGKYHGVYQMSLNIAINPDVLNCEVPSLVMPPAIQLECSL